ncbi:MAG: hypothetical protein WC332_05590 [Clostridia bacterium]
MKAVIVDVRKKTAAMLCADGSIIKVVNRNYTIGKEVDAGMTMKIMTIKTAITVAAASLLLAMGLGTSSYYLPTRYVSVDINPSIEYSINMYDRVIDVNGVNQDGEHILEELNIKSLKNKKIEDAVSMTISEAAKEGYLQSEGSGIMIATAAKNNNNAEELAAILKETVMAVVAANNSNALVMGEAVGLERVEEAKELGITPGKLNLIEKLIESSDDPESIDKEDWLDKSVKEIMELTKENTDKGEENKPSETPGQDNKPSETPGQDNKPSETPGQDNRPSETPGQDNRPSETPGQDNRPSETPGQDNKPSETPGQANKPSDEIEVEDEAESEDIDEQSSETPGQDNRPSETPGQDNKPSDDLEEENESKADDLDEQKQGEVSDPQGQSKKPEGNNGNGRG